MLVPERSDRQAGSFDEVAELYDRARPGYPPQLMPDLSALAGLRSGSRVLEIGPGTGQLTVPLGEAGYQVVAVEVGPRLAEITRRNVAPYPNVEVVEAGFEVWPLPEEGFDLVVAATAWHWLDHAVRLGKAAAALRWDGSLAVIRTHPVSGGTAGFAELATTCYQSWVGPGETFELRAPGSIPIDHELDESPLFTEAARRTYQQDITYSTTEYADLLATWSPNLALTEQARGGLLSCLAEVINQRFDGRLTMSYLTRLDVAHTRT